MKLISWNVNGIRASYKKGLAEFIEREQEFVPFGTAGGDRINGHDIAIARIGK